MAVIVESLAQMIPTDEMSSYLTAPLRSFIISMLLDDSGGDVLRSSRSRIEQLQTRLESFCLATLQVIDRNFGNFGLNIWCPLLADVCIDVGLSGFKMIYAEFERNGEVNGMTSMMKFHEHSFHVFTQVCVTWLLGGAG